MIGKLTGIVDSVGEDWVILDVNGVGYHVHASGKTLGRLQALTGAISLFVETRMREEQITLFGFVTAEERNWFRLLTQVQGVGGRVALAILSVLAPAELGVALAAEDKRNLTRADGVGPKLAARIVNELRERVPAPLSAPSPGQAIAGPSGPTTGEEGTVHDAVSALVNLGYGRTEAFMAVGKAMRAEGKEATFDVLVRAGLRELSA